MFNEDIEKATKHNANYRMVLFTGPYSQLVLMSLKPKEEIGLETHEGHDQIIVVVDGNAEVIVGSERFVCKENGLVLIPAGKQHNVINTGDEDLKLYTVYAPAEHPEGTVQAVKPH